MYKNKVLQAEKSIARCQHCLSFIFAEIKLSILRITLESPEVFKMYLHCTCAFIITLSTHEGRRSQYLVSGEHISISAHGDTKYFFWHLVWWVVLGI